MNSTAARNLAHKLMREHGLTTWNLQFDRAKSRNGYCQGSTKTISLSAYFIRDNVESVVRNTILHEIAHAIVGVSHQHDYVWRAKHIAIGGDGKRCSDNGANVDHAWKGTCPNCGADVGKQHRAPLRVKACGKCSRTWNPKAIIQWEHNGRRVCLAEMPARYKQEAISLNARYGVKF